MRNALIATCAVLYSPRQMSVNPPDATAILPRFASPTESSVEVGSCPVALHTFPNAITDFASCGSIVGYAFVEVMEGGS